MLIDRYPHEDVFARVPELAAQTDPILVQIDRLLEDDGLYQQVRADLAQRYPHTAVHGRHSTPAEVLLRLLVVKHLYDWSYQETEERVKDSLVLRWFTRVYFCRVPDDTTLLRWAQTIRPSTVQALNDRVSQLAAQVRVTRARKLRVDSTVVQTAIHHPTDGGLLADGVRVLSRLVRRAKPLVSEQLGGVREAFRSRVRSMRQELRHLHRLLRRKGEEVAAQQQTIYQKLLTTTTQMVRQAEHVHEALLSLSEAQPAPPPLARRLQAQLEHVLPLVGRVIPQARTRVLEGGKVAAADKVVSLFEPHSRVIPRHKGGAEVEFGRQVVLGEVEGGLIVHYHLLAEGESDRQASLPAVRHHRAVFGHPPRLLTGDRGTHEAKLEAQAKALGVEQVVVPRSGPMTAAQRARERERGWRRRYRWRAGVEGRISSLRRDYGLGRCLDHGEDGMERRVGWGILASNLWHIGRARAA
ncbi:MAG: ISNCY family transposase [Streptosporangiaceae bacterium]